MTDRLVCSPYGRQRKKDIGYDDLNVGTEGDFLWPGGKSNSSVFCMENIVKPNAKNDSIHILKSRGGGTLIGTKGGIATLILMLTVASLLSGCVQGMAQAEPSKLTLQDQFAKKQTVFDERRPTLLFFITGVG